MKINRPNSIKEKPIVYIVPTPIGNLKDITFRAIEVLKEVDIIACEDTRVTKKLLSYYDINNKNVISLYSQNEIKNSDKIIKEIKKNKQSLAYVSDAGTPGISDPGGLLIQACYLNDVRITCLPGPSALITAIVESNIDSSHFYFYGFLPNNKNKIEDILLSHKKETETLIFYESPLRVISTLKIIEKVFGKNRIVSLIRELTKIHEEVINGTVEEILSSNIITKGECIIVISGSKKNDFSRDEIDHLINTYYSKEESTLVLAKKISQASGISKKILYNRILELEKKNEK